MARRGGEQTGAAPPVSDRSSPAALGHCLNDPPVRTPRPVARWFTFGVIPFSAAMAVAMSLSAYLYVRQRIPAGQPQSAAVSSLHRRAAPGFALTDQHGHPVTLSSFAGKAVLVAFMDSRCTEICPVLAQMFRTAETDLGPVASRVEFVAVNVDAAANSVAAVARFSQEQGLSGFGNWYFLTGNPAALQTVWNDYGIAVETPAGASQSDHADYLYFLGPGGHERYLAAPQVAQRSDGTGYLPPGGLEQWGQRIARYLRLSLVA